MKARRLALVAVVLLTAIASIGADRGNVLRRDGIVVSPLTPQQQATIDRGLTQKQGARVRPATYTPGRHCTAKIDPLQPGRKNSKISDVRCFNKFSDALAAATGGKVRVAHSFRPDDLAQDTLDTTTADTVIGIDYGNSNFGSSTYTWWTTHTAGCTDGTSYGGNLPSSWNDEISSARGYGGCNHMNHYENANYGGSMISCRQDWTSCDTMGVMNDETSSVNLRQ